MEKRTLPRIRADLKAKRDTLSLAHESLKIDCDKYNKLIIFISLGSSLFESAKMTLNLNHPLISLVPVFHLLLNLKIIQNVNNNSYKHL